MGRRKSDIESGLEEIEIELLLIGLSRRYGYDLSGYDSELVRKHVLRRMREEKLDSVSRLSGRLIRDPKMLVRFLIQLSEGDAALFGPAGFWRAFRDEIVPFLRTYPSVRLWQAGGRPEDLYSLSILIDEALPRQVQIYATDIHESLLDRARSGALDSAKIAPAVKEYRRCGGTRKIEDYFERRNGSAVFSQPLIKKIVFGSHNPVTDGSFQKCHVVLARHLLELFGEDLKARTYRLLHDSLIPLGFLALGPGDSLKESPVADCYREISRPGRLFQKVRE